MTLVGPALARIKTPAEEFPETTFRSAGEVPPIVVPVGPESGNPISIITPELFGFATVPVASVPRKQPATLLFDPSSMETPPPLQPRAPKPLITRPRMRFVEDRTTIANPSIPPAS